ncbi:MAG: cyanophycin synthetase [Nibricoccus sp.]
MDCRWRNARLASTKLRLTKGRLEQKVIRGIQIIDDTYNANPDSVSCALRTLASMPAAGRRIAVLGRMGELGTEPNAAIGWLAKSPHRCNSTASSRVGGRSAVDYRCRLARRRGKG